MSEGNAFTSVGAPPGADDPKGQIEWLLRAVKAFAPQENDARVRPLRDKLNAALAQLRPDMTPSDTLRVNAQLADLQVETFELMATLMNQIRVTLRAQLARGMPKPKRLDLELLQRELSNFAQGIRKLALALKNNDEAKRLEANAMLARVGHFGEQLNAEADKGE